jgi:hypothetical protein
MNNLIKLAVAGALVAGAASAQATIALPSSGASDLILFAQDTVSGTSFAEDLGVTINTALPTSDLLASGSPTTDFVDTLSGISIPSSIAESSTLSTFLSAAGSDQVQWAVEAAQFPTSATNTNDKVTGTTKMISTTSQTASHITSIVVSPSYNTAIGDFEQDVNTLNGFVNAQNATATNGVWGTAAAFGGATASLNWNGTGPITSGVFLNVSSVLYGLTGNGGTGQLQSYDLGSFSLSSAGVLTFTANGGSSVPLPAAVWLLGSGLLGLAGVGRRRANQA